MDSYKVLHVINGMGSGGAEADIMNWFRKLSKLGYQFDFLIRSNQDFYIDEIKKLGGEIYRVPSFPKNCIKNIINTKKFLKENTDYDAIHIHGNTLFYIVPLLFAKLYKNKKVIVHIHSNQASGFFSQMIHFINRTLFSGLADYRIACSKTSGRFGFGNKSFMVINNGIDIDKYHSAVPIQIKRNNGEQDLELIETIFVHVGRFLPVKNQSFLIDIFYTYQKRHPNSILILIGNGPDIDKIKIKVMDLNINDKVCFVGETTMVERYLKAANILVFPSLYEGVPLVVLEAQAAGLKCMISDAITDDVIITPLVRSCSLTSNAEEWTDEIDNFLKEPIICDVYERFQKYHYDLDSVINQLRILYTE